MAQKWLRSWEVKERIRDPRPNGAWREWLRRAVASGQFPEPARFSSRLLYWDEASVDLWLTARTGPAVVTTAPPTEATA